MSQLNPHKTRSYIILPPKWMIEIDASVVKSSSQVDAEIQILHDVVDLMDQMKISQKKSLQRDHTDHSKNTW